MKAYLRISVAVVGLVLLLASCARPVESAVAVGDTWARPGVAGGNSAVYLVIDNPSTLDDMLLRANSEVAEAVEIHRSFMEGDVMRMEQQGSVIIPAGASVAFEPGGLHVMLIGLVDDLEAGETFTLTLTFEQLGSLELSVPVEAP